MKRLFLAVFPLLVLSAGASLAQSLPAIDPAVLERYVADTWKSATPEWKARVAQDETQRVCTETSNAPSPEQAKSIMAREAATVRYPSDGNVIGDWKAGERVAQSGRGGQFSDTPDTVNGGNCYACHQLRPDEVSYGTLGPSLLGYGKAREFSAEEAKAAYAKIYNAQAVFPCSQMPRFGYHNFLSEQQIRDVVAYLFAKDSPVNK